MVELLTIPPEASAEAARRQLAQTRAERVALLLPDGWGELANVARMRLLLRQAQIQRCQVALVTQHAETCKAAETLGIPIFRQAQQASNQKWQMEAETPRIDPRRPAHGLPEPPPWRREEIVERERRPSHHRARQARIRAEENYQRSLPAWLGWLGYACAGVLVIGMLGGFVRYILPAATITLKPGTDKLSITFSLIADPARREADIEAGILPARLVETTVEDTGSIATTGTQEKATLKATGQVLFTNLGGGGVNIPVGTIVSTGTGKLVQFRTTQPSGVGGGFGQQAYVPVEALEAGIEGNVRANSINNIDGPLRFSLRVNNPTVIGGGGTEFKRSVTEQDQENLSQQVLQAIKDGKDYQALLKEIEPGEWLAEESILPPSTVAEDFDHYKDEAADQLSLTLRAMVSGSAVDQEALRQLLLARVQSVLPERAKLLADSLSFQHVPSGVERVSGGVRFTVTVAADYLVPIDPNQVRRELAGLSEEQASTKAQAIWKLAAPPEFYRDPAMFGVLPSLPSRIQVRVDYGEE